ncbi:MAG: hypothetical protein RXR20_24380 [Paraburkholderia sp.]
MSSREPHDASAPHSPLQVRLYLASVVILVAGLIGAAIIYATAPAPDSAELMYGTANPQYQLELQRIGGTAEVVMAEFHQWFDSLWHGKPLAYTVAVLCTAAAGACFMAGHSRIFDTLHEPALTLRS